MKRLLILSVLFSFYSICVISQHVKPVVLISGKVYNERNLQPLGAKITYEILPEGAEAGIARTNPVNGNYKIILPYGKLYGYYALAPGYYSVTKNLDVRNLDKYTEIDEINLFLAPVKIDQVVRLNNIFFEKETATLKQESYPELNRFAEFLKINKTIEIELAGHTDDDGAEDQNLDLSKNRAQGIADYLVTRKIKEYRLTVKGYGESQPIGFNTTEEGKMMNNRIEFKVTSLVKTRK